MSEFTLHLGDSREVLKTFAENSVDSIVCDPPYHLTTGKKGGSGPASVNLNTPQGRARVTTGFMGMTWDGGAVAHDPAFWAECLRVAKPGAYLLAFGGTRTFHRLACAIEDAGWELRDCVLRGHTPNPEDCPWLLAWGFGSGFPKSHNGEWGGTALKPAWEPVVMARKPLIGTVEANWLAYGTGALNIDESRIGSEGGTTRDGQAEYPKNPDGTEDRSGSWARTGHEVVALDAGRWPANIIHDGSDEVVAAFPYTSSGTGAVKRASSADDEGNTGAAYGAESRPAGTPMICHGDEGSAARFFYCAKASQEDRNEGVKNVHPTVKPTDLMRYLCRLVTPKGGIVLDPFMGSGSTGKAAMLENFSFVGIDMTPEYVEIARARIDFARRQGYQPDLLESA